MGKSINDYICDENEILIKSLDTFLKSLKLKASNTFLVNTEYSDGGALITEYAGLQYITKLRGNGNKSFVIFYGFDDEKRLRRIPAASILNSEGVYYIQLPCTTDRFKKIFTAIDKVGKIEMTLDEKTNRTEVIKSIKLLKHNLVNVLGIIEPNINGIKAAKKSNIEAEWALLNNAILKAGMGRIEKEIELLKGMISLSAGGFKKELAAMHKQLLKADNEYKSLFNIIIRSKKIIPKIVLLSGANIVKAIKDIKERLEKIENGFKI